MMSRDEPMESMVSLISPSSHRDDDGDGVSSVQQLTWRSIFSGLGIGLLLTFSNMYSGLQTGWVTMGSLPAAILGYGLFRAFRITDFSAEENVLVQTVAVASATMPLAAGFVGVVPALAMLDAKQDHVGPVELNTLREALAMVMAMFIIRCIELLVWSVSVSFFGVFFAVPLRRRMIIKEKLRFPSGTATAEMIRVFHGSNADSDQDWTRRWQILWASFTISSLLKLISYFIPQLWTIPIFTYLGFPAMTDFLWTLTPTCSYFGQGIIMGFRTGFSTLIGAFIGWGILAPLAKSKGWATGPIEDFQTGAGGWIMWISLSIMLADSLTALFIMVFQYVGKFVYSSSRGENENVEPLLGHHETVSTRLWMSGLLLASAFCIVVVNYIFAVPVVDIVLAVGFALFVSVLAVRALGETDLNPVSGIGKISQIVFGLVTPGRTMTNILAGAIAQAGAQQSGDLMQDLKCGHLIGASPKVQLYGQLLGCAVSSLFSVFAYQLYSSVYRIGGEAFPAPSAEVWLDMARFVNGMSSPSHVITFSCVFAVVASIFVIALTVKPSAESYIPSGIGMAVGMYVYPNFTIARFMGSAFDIVWRKYDHVTHKKYVLVLASGCVLGEGMMAIVTALLKMANVPTLTS